LPPLRERAADIPGLAMHFLDKHAAELRRQIIGFSPEVMRLLERYAFPGNIRELSNIVERAAVLCRGQTIVAEDLPPHVLETPPPRAAPSPSSGPDSSAATWTACTLDEALREPERRILTAALEANQWNRQKTAEVLGINRTTLYKKMKALGIDAAPE
jgi:DNA-binding NtrC family response regulator